MQPWIDADVLEMLEVATKLKEITSEGCFGKRAIWQHGSKDSHLCKAQQRLKPVQATVAKRIGLWCCIHRMRLVGK